jgi:outer membrane protein assembly factor BamA
LGKTWRFGKNDGSAFATRLLAGAGYAYGNSSALPFEQHFYAGGANSMRGWQARSLGPGLSKPDSTFVIQNQTGDIKFEANMEYRFPMFWKFDGAIFIDAGNIWNYKSDAGTDGLGELKFNTFGESIAIDWGLGLRLDLNFILVRLDMGMRVHDPAQDAGERWRGPGDWLSKDGYAVHFGVGYPF